MIVLFGMGIALFGKIFTHVSEEDQRIHDEEQERLRHLLDSGDLVSVLESQQTYDGSSALRFPLGITNENDPDGVSNFTIFSNSCLFVSNNNNNNNQDENCFNNPGNSDIFKYPSSEFEIKNNERIYRVLLVTPESGKSNGFYKIKFGVKRDGEWYGKNQTLWVTMP
jgi:hypothetical protein